MKKEMITRLTQSFEEFAHIEQGIEFWMARDIQELLEYDKWSNFLNVIEKDDRYFRKYRDSVGD